MRIEQTVGSEVIHETGFDDTFYYLGNERQIPETSYSIGLTP